MSTVHLGFYNTATTRTHVRFAFSTHEAAGGNVAPSSAFEAADIRIYKATDGAAYSATQRSSANGITMTSPFDSLTGFHTVDIDLTDNTDAGFYVVGSSYMVVLSPDETIDSQTITGTVLAYFEIGRPQTDVREISGDETAADNLETMLDGTGGQNLTLGRLAISTDGLNPAVSILQTSGFGIHAVQVTSTAGDGVRIAGGGTGTGVLIGGGSTNGDGMYIVAGGGNASGLVCDGFGTEPGFYCGNTGTGAGAKFDGGTESGPGISVVSHAGDGLSIAPTDGNGITVTANGTSKHGAIITGGTGGTSDGMKFVAGTGGVGMRGDTATLGTFTVTTNAIAWNANWDAEVESEALDALQQVVPDSIPADGSRPSIQQAAYMIVQALTEGGISGTTWTIKKPDGSTTLFTVTLDSATVPTSKTRAS